MILSIFFCGCDQFLRLSIAKQFGLTAIYVITGSIQLLNAFLFSLSSHWHIFVSHDVVQLAECTPSLSNSLFYFLYLVMVFSHNLSAIVYLSTSSIF